MSHDHALDGMLVAAGGYSARDVRLHLEESHNFKTTGWFFSDQIRLHAKLHKHEAERLAAGLVAEKLAEAPAAVVESILHPGEAVDVVRGALLADVEPMSATGRALFILDALTAGGFPLSRLVRWGSECTDCGNGTPGSMRCDNCLSSEHTVPLYMSEAPAGPTDAQPGGEAGERRPADRPPVVPFVGGEL